MAGRIRDEECDAAKEGPGWVFGGRGRGEGAVGNGGAEGVKCGQGEEREEVGAGDARDDVADETRDSRRVGFEVTGAQERTRRELPHFRRDLALCEKKKKKGAKFR